MKKLVLAAAVLAFLAACGEDQSAVDGNLATPEPSPRAEAAPQQAAANATTGIDALTALGFKPEFAYAIAYDIVDKNNEGVNRRRVLLEVLDGDIVTAMGDAEATLARAGYTKSKETSSDGRHDVVFVKNGFPTLVFMAQSPERGPALKNSGAVGTIHIMWNIY